jgi:hypothetical protein
MGDRIDEETAMQMARQMAAAGMPSDGIVRCLVERGVDRGVAAFVVLVRLGKTSAGPDRGEVNEEERIVAAFGRLWARQIAAVVVAIGGILIVAAASTDPRGNFFGLSTADCARVGYVVTLGAAVFTYFNYRCPACNASFGRTPKPSFCPTCGVRLR